MEFSQLPGYLVNFQNTWVYGKFPKCLGIWEISQMAGYLGNFPNAWVSGKFPNCLGFWEIPQISRHLRNFKIFKIYHPQIPTGIWGISQNAWVSGKVLKWLGFWEIPQISRYLRNFQNLKNIPLSNTYRNLEIPKYLGISEISQMPIKCKCCRVMPSPPFFPIKLMGYTIYIFVYYPFLLF